MFPNLETKPVIHFAHANGFPSGTYSKLFSFLEPRYRIRFLEQHAHDPAFPVTDGWQALKAELFKSIESDFEKPVIGIGHSLGGILHLLLAAERPELYKQIILLDAPIISRFSSGGIRVLKRLGLMDRLSHSKLTRSRRNFWKTKDEAFRHFEAKSKFAAFDREVLRDYIEYGTSETPGGFRMLFEPEIEAAIYRTIPDNLPTLKRNLAIPIAYVGGSESREASLAGLGFMRRNFPIDFHFVSGSHLFPFEQPRRTAEIVHSIVADTSSQNRDR